MGPSCSCEPRGRRKYTDPRCPEHGIRAEAERIGKRKGRQHAAAGREIDMDRVAAGLGIRTQPRKVTGNLFGGTVGVLGFLRCTSCGRSCACELIQRRKAYGNDEGWWLVPKDVPGDWQIASGTSEWTCSESCAIIISKLHESGHF